MRRSTKDPKTPLDHNYGLGSQNERGDSLVEWAKLNYFIVGNTWFKVYKCRRWTWKSPDDNIRNQINYILMKERFRNSLKCCNAYPGADCESDHNPSLEKCSSNSRSWKGSSGAKRLEFELLHNDPNVEEEYELEVKNKNKTRTHIASFEKREDLETKWSKSWKKA